MEIDGKTAREHISAYDDAAKVSATGELIDPPAWFYPVVALAGPGAVLFGATIVDRPLYDAAAINIMRFVAFIIATLVTGALIVVARRERKLRTVKPLAPVRGGKTTKWMFALSFSLIAGLIVPWSWTQNEDPTRLGHLVLAVGSFLWLVFVPAHAWRRHVEEMSRR